MSNERKNQLREVFTLAWQFVKRNGFTMSEALCSAWRNVKLHRQLQQRIVKFYFQKVDGTLREAYGTLVASMIPATANNNRRRNDTVQVYYDTEKQEYRCYKKANLIKVVM